MAAVLIAFILAVGGVAPGWLVALSLASGFALLCSAAFFRDGFLSRLLSRGPIRWLGNISYSFYLVHAMVVVTVLHVVLMRMPAALVNLAFWVVLLPLFAMAFAVSAGLFLAIEKPLSLQRRPPRTVAASEATIAS
jgi:exopolysaccharide production protein ExoZ